MLQIWPAATPASTSNPKNVVLFPTWSVQTHRSGWLVAPDDPAALAEGLRRVLGDVELATKLSRNGLVVAGQFTWDRAVEKLLAVYRELGVTP